MKQRGVTLIELLAGVILIGVIAVLAAPALGTFIDSQRRLDTAQQLANNLRLARTEAILRSQPVILQALEGDWSRGWHAFVDSNHNQLRDGDEPILTERNGSPKVRVVGNSRVATRVGFDSSGRPLNNGNGTLAVCLNEPAASHYQIAIAVTGRVTLRRDGFGSEPCALIVTERI
ncbi:GspH/FimT family pseudopilin [Pseudomonas sp. NPDC087358]|uniref:GspH/FimT family pseudopilin n=1 Tax=Pseudomonas sp. NPDC087358 TaxID=3364439 RepID=UPI0038511206